MQLLYGCNCQRPGRLVEQFLPDSDVVTFCSVVGLFLCYQLGETLQVLLLPLEGLADTLVKLKQTHNWAIDSRLFAFALGLEFARNSATSSN